MDYSDFTPIDFNAGVNSQENMQTSWSPDQFDFTPYGVNFYSPTGTVGSDNDGRVFDQSGMENWLYNNDFTLSEANDTNSNMTYRGLFGNKTNKPEGPIQSFENDDPVFRMASMALAGFANPATLGAALGGSGLGATMLGGGFLGANSALYGGAKTLKDVATGAVTGAAGTGLASFNPASYLGVSNPILSGAINGGVRGGVGAAMQGGDAGSATLSGALIGGLNGIMPSAQSTEYQAVDPIQREINASNNMSSVRTPGYFDAPQPEMSGGDYGYLPTNSAVFSASDGRSQRQSSEGSREGVGDISSTLSDVFSNGIPNFSGGRVPLGDLAGGLMGLYQAYDQRKRAKNLAGQLSGNYGPNSPYAQQLRQTLMRKDAASGRRSQYGPREVEFQAKMAALNASMAPTLSDLNGKVASGNWTMANSLLNLGRLFGQGPEKTNSGKLPSLSNPMPAPNYSLGNPNGTLSGIRPEWLNTIGNGGG